MSQKAKSGALILIILASLTIISCGDEDEQRQDYTESVDTSAAQRAIDAANAALLKSASRSNIAPQIDIITPAFGAEITDSILRIEWTSTDDSDTKPVTAIYYREILSGGAPPAASGENGTNATPDASIPTYAQLMAPTNDPGNYSWDITGLRRSDYELMIQSTDGILSNVAFTRFRRN